MYADIIFEIFSEVEIEELLDLDREPPMRSETMFAASLLPELEDELTERKLV